MLDGPLVGLVDFSNSNKVPVLSRSNSVEFLTGIGSTIISSGSSEDKFNSLSINKTEINLNFGETVVIFLFKDDGLVSLRTNSTDFFR